MVPQSLEVRSYLKNFGFNTESMLEENLEDIFKHILIDLYSGKISMDFFKSTLTYFNSFKLTESYAPLYTALKNPGTETLDLYFEYEVLGMDPLYPRYKKKYGELWETRVSEVISENTLILPEEYDVDKVVLVIERLIDISKNTPAPRYLFNSIWRNISQDKKYTNFNPESDPNAWLMYWMDETGFYGEKGIENVKQEILKFKKK